MAALTVRKFVLAVRERDLLSTVLEAVEVSEFGG
jgi:hypothetical protein